MLFNSVEYLIFLPTVFILYWIIGKFNLLKLQNGLILVASYFFYGLWDWRFLFLILASTIVDYLVGIAIHKKQGQGEKGKLFLWISVIFNISLLGFFKYYNFFVDSFVDMVSLFGYSIKSTWTLNIILPVGISFYTFQTMSYSLDIYYKRIKPTHKILDFATFVAFFPQLVAGPIERASNLLGQITNKRSFKYEQSVEGLKLILWGLFKKMVIADGIAPIVDDIFANYGTLPSSTLILGVTFFSFQVYGDFSGYSDIAIGTAKLFGIELMSNFKFPNFSRNVAEYWQRWHVSLSTWFRHYLYIPLGGSRVSKLKSIRNISIIFLVSGFWHGANWTFIFWGGFHALAYIPVFLMGRNTIYKDNVVAENSVFPSFIEIGQLVLTFIIVTFSRIFFRSESLTDSFVFIKRLFTEFQWEPYHHPMGYRMIDYYILLAAFVLYEFRIRRDERSPFKFKSPIVRFCAYTLVIFCILLFFDDGVDRSFIYFQF
ncbi:MBOAT family O-acyltransferase [Flagellimonas zhangzhouensis]|uniref:D-alanyl-lipoteichoic acid acyltransferase DltB, MBOAT superfamily n=1 Tax=Flagellimonas zhangzhouensis TaxID=1073328 RepID=A0A1H2RP56_9FLAO|nr:MBOAT family O-acyltransferase [Allomuricauda zhangzhouensis]SDQ66072.1 D-alanyl-lipoteichoic acid acyltransferase DltB, MBOAT superfamily [Allomuricauda zhangzhouensis]SDW21075.1 D-alanyl-lipoteichoic acid acyltransferase DltB, MBOAT superfamily [Allomuricauda zhangzhouensis]